MTKKAAEKSGKVLYSFNAFFPGSGRLSKLNQNDWATFLFDGSTYKDVRFESFWKHETQWSVFVGAQPTEENYRSLLRQYFDATELESYCRHGLTIEPDPLLEWTADYRQEPPASGSIVRMKYKMLWTLRNMARIVKRRILG